MYSRGVSGPKDLHRSYYRGLICPICVTLCVACYTPGRGSRGGQGPSRLPRGIRHAQELPPGVVLIACAVDCLPGATTYCCRTPNLKWHASEYVEKNALVGHRVAFSQSRSSFRAAAADHPLHCHVAAVTCVHGSEPQRGRNLPLSVRPPGNR